MFLIADTYSFKDYSEECTEDYLEKKTSRDVSQEALGIFYKKYENMNLR